MPMRTTLSPEMDRWLADQEARQPKPAAATSTETLPGPVANGLPVPPCPLNEAQFAWLWPKYKACSFPPASAPKRLAGCALERLTPRGRNFAVRMAFKFRRQIFGKAAGKWAQDEFLSEVRKGAAR